MAKILFIGDVVGKPGRNILAQVLPMWKEKYQPDVTIINVENLAHGKGVTPSTLAEIDSLGVDCFTSGNHIFDKAELAKVSFEQYPKLIRPANLEGSFPGFGYYRFSKNLTPLPIPPHQGEGKKSSPFLDEQGEGRMKNQQFLVINLHGQVFCEKFFDGKLGNPFWEVDKLLKNEAQKGDIIFIDFHAEATSEKKTLGFYVDGRVSVVVGTHTHVATADAHIMKNGTAYVSDVGMTGSRDSALGVKFENALVKFLDPNAKFVNELEETGAMGINGVLVEIGNDSKAIAIQKLYQEIN